MTRQEIVEEVAEKTKVLRWMLKNHIKDVDSVGLVIAKYYHNSNELMEILRSDKPWTEEFEIYTTN
jgi:hypothetical protein